MQVPEQRMVLWRQNSLCPEDVVL